MKKFLCLTTSLIAAVCALGLGGGAVAFAETDEADTSASGYYPADFEKSFEFDELKDYAVGDDGTILFLESDHKISEYGNENVATYESKKTITHLYFQDEAFYYETNETDAANKFKVYALKNIKEPDPKPQENFVSTVTTNGATLNGFYYYFNLATGALKVNNLSTDEITSLDGFSNLKQYGENTPVYAVRTTEDNKKVLCTLNGTQTADVRVKDFEIAKSIAVGSAYDKLTSSVKSELKFVDLTTDSNAYMTEVKLNELTKNSSTFPVGDTVKVNTVDASTAVLLYTDNAGISIIAVNGKSYLVNPKHAVEKDNVYLPEDLKDTEGTATAGYIYSSPFESVGTRIIAMPSCSVKILKEIKKSDYPELDGDFYMVEYKDDETTYTGYVRFGLLSTYTFNEAPPVETPDPEETYEDLIKPVVLILIVLLLIAIAAGYLIYIGTSDKRKKKAEAATTDTTKQDKK